MEFVLTVTTELARPPLSVCLSYLSVLSTGLPYTYLPFDVKFAKRRLFEGPSNIPAIFSATCEKLVVKNCEARFLRYDDGGAARVSRGEGHDMILINHGKEMLQTSRRSLFMRSY